MLRGQKEYSIEELLEHPSLGVQLTSDGIERRCVDLVLDAASGYHRFSEIELGETRARSFMPLVPPLIAP